MQSDKKTVRPTWVLLTAFGLLACIGVIRIIFPTDFKIIVEAYYNERLLQQVSKEDSVATSWSYIFLYVIFSLALGLFVVILQSAFRDKEILNALYYLKVSGFIALLFIIKILIIRFISYVFEIERVSRDYVAILYLLYFKQHVNFVCRS